MTDQPSEELERCNRSEIPVPSAHDSVQTSEPSDPNPISSDSSLSFKRPAEDADEEPPSVRMRVNSVCTCIHGDFSNPMSDSVDTDLKDLINTVNAVPIQRGMHLLGQVGSEQGDSWNQMWEPWWERGETAGVPLELTDEAVHEAKMVELNSFAKHKVYSVVDRSVMDSNPDSILLSTKWVITNKGDKKTPVAKARLVAREFVSKAIDRDTLFAGTPGLPVMRALISRAASVTREKVRRKVMTIDIKTAFLYGKCVRPLFMKVPEGDEHDGDPTKVAELLQSLHGTRDAPQRWAEHLAEQLTSVGFVESHQSPGVFVHRDRDIELSVHVDDLLAVGEEGHLVWMEAELKKVYDLRSMLLGPGRGDVKEAKYLGRTLRWTEWGIEVQGDEKHLTELLRCTGLEGCRPVGTPLAPEDLKDVKDEDNEKKLNSSETRIYRKATALIVYISQDRPDLSVSACHLARFMQSPTQASWVKMKRVCRYLKGHPCCAIQYQWQEEDGLKLRVQTDLDWANDTRTRKSHSGGAILCGGHLLHQWSRIQPVIALSSGEAELYSSVCGLSRFAGLVNLLRELRGEEWATLQHEVDASACKSILLRKGPGG